MLSHFVPVLVFAPCCTKCETVNSYSVPCRVKREIVSFVMSYSVMSHVPIATLENSGVEEEKKSKFTYEKVKNQLI